MREQIRLQGEWWSPKLYPDEPTRGLRIAVGPRAQGGVTAQMDFLPSSRKNPIKPIFKYPSETHLGELVD
jgi:hypothetical protein